MCSQAAMPRTTDAFDTKYEKFDKMMQRNKIAKTKDSRQDNKKKTSVKRIFKKEDKKNDQRISKASKIHVKLRYNAYKANVGNGDEIWIRYSISYSYYCVDSVSCLGGCYGPVLFRKLRHFYDQHLFIIISVWMYIGCYVSVLFGQYHYA